MISRDVIVAYEFAGHLRFDNSRQTVVKAQTIKPSYLLLAGRRPFDVLLVP